MGTAGFDASGVRGEENNWLCTRVLALLGRANVGVCVGECARTAKRRSPPLTGTHNKAAHYQAGRRTIPPNPSGRSKSLAHRTADEVVSRLVEAGVKYIYDVVSDDLITKPVGTVGQ